MRSVKGQQIENRRVVDNQEALFLRGRWHDFSKELNARMLRECFMKLADELIESDDFSSVKQALLDIYISQREIHEENGTLFFTDIKIAP